MPRCLPLLALALFVSVPTGPAPRADVTELENRIYLRVGSRAPAFAGVDEQGRPWQSKRFLGKKVVVVYFYLGDFMPGCTTQAKAFQRDLERLRQRDVEVVGVSGDTASTHRRFKKANKLAFPLLADPDGKIPKALGVSFSGGGQMHIQDDKGKTITIERGVTISRWMLVIGKDGRVLHKDTNVKVEEGGRRVLSLLTRRASR